MGGWNLLLTKNLNDWEIDEFVALDQLLSNM